MRKAKFAQSNATEWKARGFKNSNAPQTEGESSEAGNQSREKAKNNFQPRATGANRAPKRLTEDAEQAAEETPTLPVKKQKVAKKAGKPSQDTLKETKDAGGDGGKASPKKKKKQKKTLEEGEAAAGSDGDEAAEVDTSNPKRKKQKFQGYTLFIGNLSYDTTKEDIQNHFSKCGTIKNVRIPMDKETNNPRGFGYIEVDEHVTYEVIN